MRKFARTISGVTPVAVMAQPMGCPGKCVYCPDYAGAPRSYTPESPAVLRARGCGFDPAEQVRVRLSALEDMGHPTDKVELIVMGGTFLAAPADYQYRFIKECYDALNGIPSETLEEAKFRNEISERRCTGLCIETRPDWCGEAEVSRMLEFGATRVELGVQALDDEIFRLVRRGHGIKEVVTATALLRRRGLKVHYHWMPGLPGSSPGKDLEMSRMLFEDERFRPDGLKLYPTMVVETTELEKWYAEGRYQPYEAGVMIALLAGIKSIVPPYVRISRVLRDIPPKFITAGCKDSLRALLREEMGKQGAGCRCVRCREYGHRLRQGFRPGEPGLARLDYAASGGKEVFLSFEDENGTLFGLLRLRFQPEPLPGLAGASAIVRELHIYGPEVPLSGFKEDAAQHRGLGKTLLAEAERLARDEFRVGSLTVLSGVGAREYYRSLGYDLRGSYMVKSLPVLARSGGNGTPKP